MFMYTVYMLAFFITELISIFIENTCRIFVFQKTCKSLCMGNTMIPPEPVFVKTCFSLDMFGTC